MFVKVESVVERMPRYPSSICNSAFLKLNKVSSSSSLTRSSICLTSFILSLYSSLKKLETMDSSPSLCTSSGSQAITSAVQTTASSVSPAPTFLYIFIQTIIICLFAGLHGRPPSNIP